MLFSIHWLYMQKFSQIYLKKLKNSKITPKKIKNTNSQKFKQSPKFCHTERSEVSTQIIENRLLNVKFMDISLTLNMTFCCGLRLAIRWVANAQNDKGVPSLCYKNAFCPSLRASKASVAIQKVKITLNLWLATQGLRLTHNDKFLQNSPNKPNPNTQKIPLNFSGLSRQFYRLFDDKQKAL